MNRFHYHLHYAIYYVTVQYEETEMKNLSTHECGYWRCKSIRKYNLFSNVDGL
jgi:hypothetical protein